MRRPCEMWAEAVPERGYSSPNVHSVMRAECRCRTHGMSGFSQATTSTGDAEMDVLCPIGKIELATERALKQIAALKGA